jgi:hypothetical protein
LYKRILFHNRSDETTMRLWAIGIIGVMLVCAAEPDQAWFGPGGTFQLEYSTDSAGTRSHGVIERLADGGTKVYPLPQSSLEIYAKLRPADLKLNPIVATGGQYERDEVIGPHQVEGDWLWFGNVFYDGEGERGVGAFGYFDTVTRDYQLFSPPEVAPYEVSAILVDRNAVWLALDHAGEDISTFPGGLVEWSRVTHGVVRYPIEFVVTKIARYGDSLRMTTRGGYALLKDGVIHRFQVQADTSGRVETMAIERFPPPPSTHHR